MARILDDSDQLLLYTEIETDDKQLADALAGADTEGAESPEGFVQCIREIVREDLQEAGNNE